MSTEQKDALDANLRQVPLDLNADVTALRAGFDAAMAQVPVPDDVEQQPTSLGGVDAIEVAIRGVDAAAVLLYFHGGVYVIGSARSTVPLVSDLARRTRVNAVTVDYRLAPEHPYPAAVDDALAAYRGLLERGVDPARIALAGESAGGGLVIALLLALRDAGLGLPSCAYLMSPYVDLTLSGETLLEKQDLDPLLTPEGLRLRVPDYVGGAVATNPQISPVFGDLVGLPPLLIQAGSHEILLSDALRLADRAARDDVSVALEITPGVPHVFQGFASFLDEGDAALTRAAAFLTAHLSET
ncbi:MAG TPA: alpha/beta hydrolase [Acidimicrobiia bacterium]|jgi:acetyl esterase/lipase